MDYKTIAKQIAISENPYEEFSKEASRLDETHQTTLAREVNKQIFLHNLENRDGDGHIDFEIISPTEKSEHVKTAGLKENEGLSLVKTAYQQEHESLTKTASYVDPKMQALTPDKFKIEPTHINRDKMMGGGTTSNRAMLEKNAEFVMDELYEKRTEEELKAFKENKTRALAMTNNSIMEKTEEIVKLAEDASEMRDAIYIAIETGNEDIIDNLVLLSNETQDHITKVASSTIPLERRVMIQKNFHDINGLKKTKELVKTATSNEELEKLGFLGTVLKAGSLLMGTGLNKAAVKIGKAGLGTAKKVGKVGLKAADVAIKNPATIGVGLMGVDVANKQRAAEMAIRSRLF